jgi:hypothetical protein
VHIPTILLHVPPARQHGGLDTGTSTWCPARAGPTSTRDPLIVAAVPGVLVAVAALARVAPAIRAAPVDPVIARRSE